MKKILFLLMASLLFFSCKEAEPEIYNGDSLLHFTKGDSDNAFVLLGSGSSTYKLAFGVTKPVVGNSDVKLIFDQSKSTAQLGTDFQIVSPLSTQLSAGQAIGSYDIKILEATATPTPKTAVFRLESSSLQGASWYKEFTLNIALSCPASTFVGTFQTKTALFSSPYLIEIEEGTAPNTLVLKDYIEVGTDITVTYDPSTGNVTFPTQSTGYMNGSVNVQIKQAIDGSASKVDFCNRKLDLRVTYGPPGGNYSIGGVTSHTETSTGL